MTTAEPEAADGGRPPLRLVSETDRAPVADEQDASATAGMDTLVAAALERREEIRRGDLDAVARQHAAGKYTARERLDLLLDAGSFVELEPMRRTTAAGPKLSTAPPTDGVVTGSGTVEGRTVCVWAQDFTVLGGSLGEAHAEKIYKVMDMAVRIGAPIIALHDSGGARIQEGVAALDGYGGIFRRSVAASGVVPQIAVVLGPCAGGAAYAPALSDVTFMVRDVARMYLTGPDVVRAVTGADVGHEDLGGALLHGTTTGLASVVGDDDEQCLADVRTLVALLPANNVDPAPAAAAPAGDDRRPALTSIVSTDPTQPYDVRDVIVEIVDDGVHFELGETWAPNVITTVARIGGMFVGIVANQPAVIAGVLDRAASEKAARFVRFCDAFSIALVSLVDVPGFLPGLDQEREAVIRHGAQLLYAYCEATVPRISVILRKAYGGAYIVMDSRSLGCDLALAWPSNEIAVLGASSAVDVLFRRELGAADDPDALRAEYVRSYTERYLHAEYAAERGFVDDVIDPAETRAALRRGLTTLRDKRVDGPRRKHGNVPL